MITSDKISENPIRLCLGDEDFQPSRIFLRVGCFELKECEHSDCVELVFLDDEGSEMTGMDLRDPQTVEALRRENARRPIVKANGNIGLRVNKMKNIDRGNVTSTWIKDGVKLQETDELYWAVGDDDDYHPDNKLRLAELHRIRDGEVIARMWWIR